MLTPTTGPQHRIRSHRMAIALASVVFCIVSMAVNVHYGMTLGTSTAERALYVAASVAADLVKIAAPALALTHWEERKSGLAVVAFALWLAAVIWSTSSAVGFALSTRETANAQRLALADDRSGWTTTIERAESGLTALGRVRPSTVINAEIASLTIDPVILRRTRHCSELASETARRLCAPMLRLKAELAAAEAAERLQAEAVTSRTQLAAIPVVGSQPDPPAKAIARLIGTDEGTVRVGFALLLAGLIEAGSALGLTLVSIQGRNRPAPRLVTYSTPSKPARAVLTRHAQATLLIELWVDEETRQDPTAEIQARAAYQAFTRWTRGRSVGAITETKFGREFTRILMTKGGVKTKRRDGAYYRGIALD